jgi:hypothetical protein
MKRLAWTLILLGLAVAASPTIVHMFDDEVAGAIAMWPFVGMVTLLSGCVLLAGAWIADAITKAQGTREGP